jgi:hypothetical protein
MVWTPKATSFSFASMPADIDMQRMGAVREGVMP